MKLLSKLPVLVQVPDTKGTLRCCVGRNPYNGYKYLCGATNSSLYLMQWYDPLNKFMLLKVGVSYSIYSSPDVYNSAKLL